MLLCAAQVGKTSLILSLVSEEFPEEVRFMNRPGSVMLSLVSNFVCVSSSVLLSLIIQFNLSVNLKPFIFFKSTRKELFTQVAIIYFSHTLILYYCSSCAAGPSCLKGGLHHPLDKSLYCR